MWSRIIKWISEKMRSLAKVSDRKFQIKTNYSESFTNRVLANVNHISKKSLISFIENRLKINPTRSETSIRMNPNQSESRFIRIENWNRIHQISLY